MALFRALSHGASGEIPLPLLECKYLVHRDYTLIMCKSHRGKWHPLVSKQIHYLIPKNKH